MKRVNNIYNNIVTYSNISNVFDTLVKNINNKKYLYNYIKYKNCFIMDILERLYNRNYIFSKYNIFLIKDKKYRIIMSECISDKLVNYFISYYILIPNLKCLIDSTVATRKNKGCEYAYKLFNKYIYKLGINNIYVLKIDIKKYFYNINHNKLKSMLERKFKDRECLNLIYQVIDNTDNGYINDEIINIVNKEIDRVNKLNISSKEKDIKIKELRSIPLYRNGIGLSIGCLTNQILANFYLHDIDVFIKEKLKCKYYIRYMDDLIILDKDKNRLNRWFKDIESNLNNIDLEINKKSNIYKLDVGVSFLGYTYKVNNNKLIIKYNKKTISKINKKLKYLKKHNYNKYILSLNSYKGYFNRSNTKLKANICSKKIKKFTFF